MVAIIGGEPHRFRPHIDLYREAGRRAGHTPELRVGLHCIGFLGDTTQQAADDFFPGYAHTFTEIGKERGWPPTTRAQFDATRGPKGALIIGDAETVTRKDPLHQRSAWRHFPHYFPDGGLDASPCEDDACH